MKYFNCGNCKTPHQIDEQMVKKSIAVVTCSDCGAKNTLRFGPILIAQTKNGVKKYSLKPGVNQIGRKTSEGSNAIGLEDGYVSRNHAEIYLENKDNKFYFYIKDLGSKNGTFTKGKNRLKDNLKYAFTKNDYYIVGLTKLSLQVVG
jgi:hypothetical protein